MNIIQSNGKVIIDGVVIKNPPKPMLGSCVIQSGNDVYINGYKLDKKTGKFKFSLFGMLNYIF